jgi:hypothetical protein
VLTCGLGAALLAQDPDLRFSALYLIMIRVFGWMVFLVRSQVCAVPEVGGVTGSGHLLWAVMSPRPLYLILMRMIGRLVLLARSQASRDLEILVWRRGLAVLCIRTATAAPPLTLN